MRPLRALVLPLVAVTVFLAMTGCLSVGPDYTPPELAPLNAWHARLTEGVEVGDAQLQTWWKTFDDPVLDQLLGMVLTSSPDLRIAAARVEEARALRGVAAGAYVPAVGGGGSATGKRTSEDFLASGQTSTDWIHSVGLDASWEIDFWGRIRRSVEAADATLDASIEDYRDALVVLYAEAATAYIDARALQARLSYARENAKLQRESVQLTKDRLEAELVPELDVLQAELVLGSTEAQIPTLRALINARINELAVLTGSTAADIGALMAGAAPIPTLPRSVLIGTPADVLRQRPDVRNAERQLAAQTARVGIATAELLPKFSLSGTFGYEGFSQIFQDGKRAWTFGPSFQWRLFEGGRLRSQIKAENARVKQALANYERTVLVAYADFETAVNAYLEETARLESLRKAMVSAEAALDKVLELYRTGLTDFQNVLDMQRSLTVQQDAYASSAGQVASNLVGIYRAMGGGVPPAQRQNGE